MTAFREAVVLPTLFLTVVLLGAIRPGAQVTVVPPSLGALLAAVVLVALLVRSGAVDPNRLLHPGRSAVASLNGCSVILTAFMASAQVVTMLVPESGLPALVAWVVLISLLLQALAIGPDRARLLRGLMVTFSAAFALKYIVLASISAPADSRVARALQLLFEGVTLGGVTQRPPHVVEGYLAFATIMLYLIAIAALPAASWQMVRTSRSELTDGPSIPARRPAQYD